MSDAKDPFRLEDESPEDRPSNARDLDVEPIEAGAPEGNGRPGAEVESADDPPSRRDAARPGRARIPPEISEVDERTWAEKQGRAVDVVAGRRPPPEGWPVEALAFPLRGPGPVTMAGGSVLWVLLDLASRLNFFLGLLLKVLAVPLFLRWQLHVASRSAAGQDEPAGWARAMDMETGHLVDVGRLLVAGVLLALPGSVALALGRPWLGGALLVGAGLWLAAGGLGAAVRDRRLLRPWHALAWIGRRPLGLLAATFGWWATGLTEWAMHAWSDASLGLYGVASLALRAVGMYGLLLSARALGVVGRSWSAVRDEEA